MPLHTPSLLDVAISTADWLAQHAVESGGGIAWPLDPANPEAFDDTLFNGNAGTALFLLQLAEVTGEERVWDLTRQAGESLVAHLNAPRAGLPLDLPGAEHTLYLGAPGVAWALAHLGLRLDESQFIESAVRATESLLTHGLRDDKGLHWTNQAGILADGGTVLFLLDVGSLLGREDWTQAGVDAARRIATLGTPDLRGGTAWDALDPSLLGSPAGARWPNFEFGTAGVGYVLARAHEVTGEHVFLDVALAAAEHIRAIAVRDGDAALVPYREPDLQDLFYLGNCHGPVGTSRLFLALDRMTGDPAHKTFIDNLFNGLLASGAPEQHSPGYWNATTACCGTAAFVNWGVGLYSAFREDRYLEFADRAAQQLIGEGFVADDGPNRWFDAFTRTDPTTVNARTSLLTGSAGNALALLHLHLLHQGQLPTLRLPDDPWPTVERTKA